MKTLRLFFPATAILITTLIACQSPNRQEAATPVPETQTTVAPVTSPIVDTFSMSAAGIRGCACYFSTDSAGYATGRFLFANDNNAKADGTGTGYMRIDGDMLTFTRTSITKTEQETTINYRSGDYQLTVLIRFDSSSPQEPQVLGRGSLTLQAADGRSEQREIFGYCGC